MKPKITIKKIDKDYHFTCDSVVFAKDMTSYGNFSYKVEREIKAKILHQLDDYNYFYIRDLYDKPQTLEKTNLYEIIDTKLESKIILKYNLKPSSSTKEYDTAEKRFSM